MHMMCQVDKSAVWVDAARELVYLVANKATMDGWTDGWREGGMDAPHHGWMRPIMEGGLDLAC